jgi:hypothetical protein
VHYAAVLLLLEYPNQLSDFYGFVVKGSPGSQASLFDPLNNSFLNCFDKGFLELPLLQPNQNLPQSVCVTKLSGFLIF